VGIAVALLAALLAWGEASCLWGTEV